jgi:hypothetical protein
LTSTQVVWTPSVQSPLEEHAPSTAHAPLVPQSGPAALADCLHSESDAQARHEFAPQIGVFGTSMQPESSMQSRHVAVVESHWVVPPHPALPIGSHAEQWPFCAPAEAHWGVEADLDAHRASPPAVASQAAH